MVTPPSLGMYTAAIDEAYTVPNVGSGHSKIRGTLYQNLASGL
jgi:hypothetical protein